jgi:hypothetical protein
MNTVWCENLAGITGLTTTNLYEDYTKFGSYQYLGDKSPYLDYPCGSDLTSTASTCNTVGLSYDDEVSKSISIFIQITLFQVYMGNSYILMLQIIK